MRKYILEAFNESGVKLFCLLVNGLEDGIKKSVNHEMASRISWIEYRNHKYTMSQLLEFADKHFQNKKRKICNSY